MCCILLNQRVCLGWTKADNLYDDQDNNADDYDALKLGHLHENIARGHIMCAWVLMFVYKIIYTDHLAPHEQDVANNVVHCSSRGEL